MIATDRGFFQLCGLRPDGSSDFMSVPNPLSLAKKTSSAIRLSWPKGYGSQPAEKDCGYRWQLCRHDWARLSQLLRQGPLKVTGQTRRQEASSLEHLVRQASTAPRPLVGCPPPV
jgi:hypothetical protein